MYDYLIVGAGLFGYIHLRWFYSEDFSVLETYGIDPDKSEIYDLLNYLGLDAAHIMTTPAILRKMKKVVYIFKTSNNDENNGMEAFIYGRGYSPVTAS